MSENFQARPEPRHVCPLRNSDRHTYGSPASSLFSIYISIESIREVLHWEKVGNSPVASATYERGTKKSYILYQNTVQLDVVHLIEFFPSSFSKLELMKISGDRHIVYMPIA